MARPAKGGQRNRLPDRDPILAALDGLPAAALMTDAQGAITFANAQAALLLGVPAGTLPRLGWAAVAHPADLPGLEAALAAALAAQEPLRHRLRAASGAASPCWVTLSANPRYDAAGRFLGLTAILQDVTAALRAEAALREAEERTRTLLDAAPFSVIIIDTETYEILDVNEFACHDYGYTREEFLRLRITDIDALGSVEAIRARGRANSIRPGTQEFEAQHRDKSGTVRDVLVRVQGALLDGRRVTFGAHFDITGRKAVEERQRLLMRELDHRARNVLAVVQAALRLTPRDNPEAYAQAVEGRVRALARAHTLLAEGSWSGAELRALLAAELQPFLAEQRVELQGPRLMLPPTAAQSLAMALHELATNAVKHGALSVQDGRLAARWQLQVPGRLRLEWVERDGPELAGAPARSGFGSRVLDATIRRQLGGRAALQWDRCGLTCVMEVPLAEAAA